ncbi:hypothetical protein EGW08_010113, partial [Elysia chlorotica]
YYDYKTEDIRHYPSHRRLDGKDIKKIPTKATTTRGVFWNGVWSLSDMMTQLLLLLLLLCHGGEPQWNPREDHEDFKAQVELSLSHHPGRVYSGAGPDLLVMQVSGVNTITGEQVSNFKFEQSAYADYFNIDSMGYIRTRREINFGLSKEFGLMVVGQNGNKVGYKYIQIIVSEENLFPPEFETDNFRFQIYGRDVGATIGRIPVYDKDEKAYNRDVLLRAKVDPG